MKTKHNRDRLFKMLAYMETHKNTTPLMLICEFLCSMYELNLAYNKTHKGKYNDITIDMQDQALKDTSKKAYYMNKEGSTSQEIYRSLKHS